MRATAKPRVNQSTLGDAGLRQFYRVPGEDIIYMGVLEDPRIGRPLGIYTMPQNLGMMTPSEAIGERIPSLTTLDGYGFSGLNFRWSRNNESMVLERWRDGSGLDQWVAMPYVVLSGADCVFERRRFIGRSLFSGSLYENWREGDLCDAAETSGNIFVELFGSCKNHWDSTRYVLAVSCDERGGTSFCPDRDDSRVSWLPCLARNLTP